MQITLENIDVTKHKLVNSLFRYGYIVVFEATGEVVGFYQEQRALSHKTGYKKLPNTQPGPTGGHELKALYPNCAIRRVVKYGCIGWRKLTYEQIRAAAEFIGDQGLAPYAFWPSSNYHPERRPRTSQTQPGAGRYVTYWQHLRNK